MSLDTENIHTCEILGISCIVAAVSLLSMFFIIADHSIGYLHHGPACNISLSCEDLEGSQTNDDH